MDVRRFIATRPRLFHLTAAMNIDRIQRTGGLVPAYALYREAGLAERIHQRRRGADVIPVNGDTVHIRDNGPLHPGNMTLVGCTFGEFVAYLNQHVFFWAGKDDGPVPAGRNHFVRYRNDDCVVLEIRTEALLEANPEAVPLFCKYNSGAPRCISGIGKGSPRSQNMFLAASDYDAIPSTVKEVTFASPVAIPWEATVVRTLRQQLERLSS